MHSRTQWTRAIALITALSFALHFFHLLMIHPMWDEWLWLSYVKEGDVRFFWDSIKQSGHHLALPYTWLSALFPNLAFGSRLIALILHTANALLAARFLNKAFAFTFRDAILVGFFFLVSPLNDVYLEISYYNFLVFSFLAAANLIADAGPQSKAWHPKKLLSYALFLASFTLSSLMLLYPAVILALYAQDSNQGNLLRTPKAYIQSFLSTNWPALLLPFVFWTLRSTLLKPYGIYEEYNHPGLPPHLLDLLSEDTQILFARVIEIVHDSFQPTRASWTFLASGGAITAAWFLFKQGPQQNTPSSTTRSKLLVLATAFIAILFGILPYLLVGKRMGFWDWHSRHCVAAAFGMNVLLGTVAALILDSKRHLQPFAIVLVALFCGALMSYRIFNSVSWLLDNLKQASVIEHLSESPTVKSSNIVSFEDSWSSLNTLNRIPRDYEYAGILKTAFGNESRLPVVAGTQQDAERNISKLKDSTISRFYLLSSAKKCGLVQIVRIAPGSTPPGQAIRARLFAILSGSDRYSNIAKNLAKVEEKDRFLIPCNTWNKK